MEGPKKRGLGPWRPSTLAEFTVAGASAATPGPDGELEIPAPEANTREVISRKELARQLRRQAYQRAKAARAVDPKHLAMKEAAKQRQRELYRRVKEQRKARSLQEGDSVTGAAARGWAATGVSATRGAPAGGSRASAKNAAEASPKHAGESKASLAKQRAEAKRQLAERVRSALGPASEPARALARDIERALQCADVKELIDQLRAQSASLAAQHREGDPLAVPRGAAPPVDDDLGA